MDEHTADLAYSTIAMLRGHGLGSHDMSQVGQVILHEADLMAKSEQQTHGFFSYPDPTSCSTFELPILPTESLIDPSLRADNGEGNDHTKSDEADQSKISRSAKKTHVTRSRNHTNCKQVPKCEITKPKHYPSTESFGSSDADALPRHGAKRWFSTPAQNMAADAHDFPQQCPSNLDEEDHVSWSRCRDILLDRASYDLRNFSTEKAVMDRLAWTRQVLRLLQEVAEGRRKRTEFRVQGQRVKWLRK
ncbi:hypothetical protein N7G274_008043 [Stereocaulon virgatum]|uniref:Uncharacterized protein n=1 Tax=Stereocaulon virgatum TaxID=373712 RepID=A0ABR4A2T9_9LECA